MSTQNRFQAVAERIEKEVEIMHAEFKPRRWNPLCGQWLVYGFERNIGFAGAVCLEAAIETAWRTGASVQLAAITALTEALS